MKYSAVMAAHTVIVCGKEVRITVERRSKSIWIVPGDYMGKPIQVKDVTERAIMCGTRRRNTTANCVRRRKSRTDH